MRTPAGRRGCGAHWRPPVSNDDIKLVSLAVSQSVALLATDCLDGARHDEPRGIFRRCGRRPGCPLRGPNDVGTVTAAGRANSDSTARHDAQRRSQIEQHAIAAVGCHQQTLRQSSSHARPQQERVRRSRGNVRSTRHRGAQRTDEDRVQPVGMEIASVTVGSPASSTPNLLSLLEAPARRRR